MATTFCSIAETTAITGVTVTQSVLDKAHYDIEIFSGRLFQRLAVGVLHDDDVDWLKRAIAHQAVFVNERPEKDVGMEGVDAVGDAPVLGMMARRALSNVSWVGARTVRISKTTTVGDAALDTTLGDIEGAPWRSM